MEIEQTSDTSSKRPQQQKKVTKEKTSLVKKLDQDTAKLLGQIKDKVNRKDFGRKIRDNEIIAQSLRLITSDHIKSLQENSYTGLDRIKMLHDDYQKKHGKITYEQFLLKMYHGEITPGTVTNKAERLKQTESAASTTS